MSTAERRHGDSVVFERGIGVHIMGIDGTWRCDCTMLEVSEAGARLNVERPVQGLNLKEFFLVLSSTGLAFRRCELTGVNGHQISASFVAQNVKVRPRVESAFI